MISFIGLYATSSKFKPCQRTSSNIIFTDYWKSWWIDLCYLEGEEWEAPTKAWAQSCSRSVTCQMQVLTLRLPRSKKQSEVTILFHSVWVDRKIQLEPALLLTTCKTAFSVSTGKELLNGTIQTTLKHLICSSTNQHPEKAITFQQSSAFL